MKKTHNRGFTLIELLTVIGIIAILAGILIPTIGAVQERVAKVRTQTQFKRYENAYQLFKSDYGYYPKMGESSDTFRLMGNNEVFIQTLAGTTLEGEPMTNQIAKNQNKRNRQYHAFDADEFGLDDTEYEDQIVTAFNDPDIVVVVDEDDNNAIPMESVPIASDVINAGVIFYTEEKPNLGLPEVTSWK